MKKFLCFVINNFGSGGHPVADEAGLHFFTREYILTCVKTAIASDRLSPAALELGNQYLTEN